MVYWRFSQASGDSSWRLVRMSAASFPSWAPISRMRQAFGEPFSDHHLEKRWARSLPNSGPTLTLV